MPLGASAVFFAGCYGISRKHGFVYHSTVGFTPIGVPLLPIQLIEAGTLLVLFAVQLFLFLHRHRIGRNTVFYFFAYPAVRFVLAFFRSDAERGKLLGSSTSQWGERSDHRHPDCRNHHPPSSIPNAKAPSAVAWSDSFSLRRNKKRIC